MEILALNLETLKIFYLVKSLLWKDEQLVYAIQYLYTKLFKKTHA